MPQEKISLLSHYLHSTFSPFSAQYTMRFALLSLLPLVLALPATILERAPKPVYWLLAGDSTTAPAGGWGDAFLSTTVASGSSGHNYAKSGASTASFRAGSYWKKVIDDVIKYKNQYLVYVTIQVSTHHPMQDASSLAPRSSATTIKKPHPAYHSLNTPPTSENSPTKS